MRHRLMTILSATLALMIATVQPAYAAVTLTAMSPVLSNVASEYPFTTGLQYWSVIALRPVAGADYDLRLRDSAGTLLASSAWGAGATDFVAINSTGGYRPLGGYKATVAKYSGSGGYDVMFFELRVVMPVPTDPIGNTSIAQALGFTWPAAAVAVYLQANQGFRVNYASHAKVFLAGSTPGVPGSAVRNRSSLENANVVADNLTSPNGSKCRVFVAPTAGWYSLIAIWTTPYTPPPYNGGSAFFPQRYNPALGDTLSQCPDPNIP